MIAFAEFVNILRKDKYYYNGKSVHFNNKRNPTCKFRYVSFGSYPLFTKDM